MELHSLTCPNCNADLEIENNLDIFYCKYCGHKVVLDGQSNAAYRARTELVGMQHEEVMAREQYEHNEKMKDKEYKHDKFRIILGIFSIIFLIIIPGLLGMIYIDEMFDDDKKSSDMQEKQLQSLVEEIQVDIENGDFDTAFIKAESIDYTEDWSDEIDVKWDNIRREIKNQIIEAEKEETGKSKHKPEREKFLGIF